MKKSSGVLLFTLFVIFFSASSCEAGGPEGKGKDFTVAFYNVENLFDTIDDPHKNDNEFLPHGNHTWNTRCYQIKLANLARVIDSLGDSDGPELLGLAEIENRAVLEDLIRQPRLAGKGYAIVHYESPDQRGIDVALIYKTSAFKLISSFSAEIPFPENPDIETRDILFVKGLAGKKDTLTIAVNHWPSRLGGEEKSGWKRKRAASILRQKLDSIRTENGESGIIVMGDLNDEPVDSSVTLVLGSSGIAANVSEAILYNPWVSIFEAGKEGSLMYNKKWDMFDQIMVSKSLISRKKGVSFEEGFHGIYHPDWMQVAEGSWKSAPRRSHIKKEFYEDGYSDHFPVFVRLQLR